VFGLLSAGTIVGAIALANFDLGLSQNWDLDLDAPRALPHRPPQPPEVCLPLYAVRAAAEDTWHVAEPAISGRRPTNRAAARLRVYAELTKFERALRQAKRVAPEAVRPHLEQARHEVARSRRDATADISFDAWKNFTWGNAMSGYFALSEGGLALGDACGFDLKPLVSPS
jgi:hypothetical protein